jgi:hypothetical protein
MRSVSFLAALLTLSCSVASLISCPDHVGAPKWGCGSDSCGGETKENSQQCKNIECDCEYYFQNVSNDPTTYPDRVGDPEGPTADTLTTITATPSTSGEPVVATFALQTISSLTGLKEAITTTVTSPGTSGKETAVAVVAAGGVAWFLSGFLGDAAVVESIVEPPEVDGHPDDETCPNSRAECPDCNGIGGMCITGPNLGCACDPHQCPENKPSCLDCGGNSGKDPRVGRLNQAC